MNDECPSLISLIFDLIYLLRAVLHHTRFVFETPAIVFCHNSLVLPSLYDVYDILNLMLAESAQCDGTIISKIRYISMEVVYTSKQR
jgi:hypothetical protein